MAGKMPPSQTGFGGFLLPIFISEKSIRKRNSMIYLNGTIYAIDKADFKSWQSQSRACLKNNSNFLWGNIEISMSVIMGFVRN